MENLDILKRLNCIVKIIEKRNSITKDDLIEKLSVDYDIETSSRTFDRDKNVLMTDFGIEINYNRNLRGYILEKNEEALLEFFKFTKFAAMAQVYESGYKDYKSFQKWVIPEDSSNFMGVEHFKELLQAISLNKQITFDKENYYNKTNKTYKVSPICLKEYANRWYLIALVNGETEIKNFGIDRISNLELLSQSGEKVPNLKGQLKQYKDVVGLNYSQSYSNDVDKIVIRAHNDQLKYLRSLPIHHSQVCLNGKGDDWGTVTYNLKPNYEFELQVLKLGNMIEVVEPLWFRKKIKEHIHTMYNLYN